MIHFYLNLLNGFSIRLKKQRSQSKNLCLLILGELLPKKKEWEYFHVDSLNKIYHPSSQSRTWDYGQSKQFSERICSNNLKDWSQLWFIYIDHSSDLFTFPPNKTSAIFTSEELRSKSGQISLQIALRHLSQVTRVRRHEGVPNFPS